MSPRLDIDALLDDRDVGVIVCCGSGGVGKTTTAAALALRAAHRGRTVCVLTIDPARRLAQSMGLSQLDNTEAHADPERAAQILANPFYQSMSSSFAGTQEYMAMEKLGQLRAQADADGSWDLIIVDTPPSRSALDFLDAPQRMGSFLDGRLIRVFTAPARAGGRGALRVVSLGVGAVTNVLSRLIGAQLLSDVSTFVAAIDSTFGGFRERAELTYALLKEPGTSFLVVAAPEPDALREASYFVERLEADAMPLAGLVLNRVHDSPALELTAERALAAAEELGADLGHPGRGEHRLAAGLLLVHAERMQVIERERRMARRFSAAHPRVPVAAVRALPTDVHDLAGLREVGAALGGSGSG